MARGAWHAGHVVHQLIVRTSCSCFCTHCCKTINTTQHSIHASSACESREWYNIYVHAVTSTNHSCHQHGLPNMLQVAR
jgi:hypothetical protein